MPQFERAGEASKSKILFCSAPPRMYQDAATYDGTDLSDVQMPGGRSMHIVDKFKYLGDYVARDCTDVCAVDARVADAGRAFGALRRCLFASHSISFAAKKAVYEALILSILLYGCECWCMTEVLRQRLHVFHAQCLRAMCRVTRKHTWEHHITSVELMQRLGLDGIDFYVARRQMRWLGHVRRMPMERLPRRMLSAWVPHARPVGAPRLTFGRSVAKAMDVFDLDSARWPELAADRGWRGRRCCATARRLPPSVSRRLPRCRCPFRTSSSGHAAARLSEPTRPSTPRCASWRVCRGSASSRRSATSRKHHLLLYILPWSRDTRRTLTRV